MLEVAAICSLRDDTHHHEASLAIPGKESHIRMIPAPSKQHIEALEAREDRAHIPSTYTSTPLLHHRATGCPDGSATHPVNHPEIRWLGWKESVRIRFEKGVIGASTVTFVVLGQPTFARLRKTGLWLLARRYDVEAFEEDRPDAFCAKCCGGGHRALRTAAAPLRGGAQDVRP